MDRALNLGLIVLVLGVGVVSWHRAARGEFDFEHFYLDGRYVWTHGALNPNVDDPDPALRRRLPFYLPVVPLAVSPLTALGLQPAALLWAILQTVAVGISLRVLRRWCGRTQEQVPLPFREGAGGGSHLRTKNPFPALPLGGGGVSSPSLAGAFILALLLALPAFFEAAKFNQLSFFVLALVLGAIASLDRARPVAAGALLGFASVLKLLPAVFLLWLLLKRRWAAAVALVSSALLIALLPPLLAFGPRQTVEYHRQWWEYNIRGDAAAGLLNADLREHFIDQRNQSIAQVVARLTWPKHPYPAAYQPLQLERETCTWVAWGIGGLLLVGLALTTRGRWDDLSIDRRRAEAAVYAIAMIVFSPLLRQYYLVWAVPALVLLARVAAGDAGRRWGRIGLAIWALGMLAWMWPAARVLGAHLVMLLALGICLLAGGRGSRRAV